jgi:hypothetical protein
MRKLTTLVAVALMALAPAAANAHRGHGVPGKQQAAAACKAERQADKDAFKAKYANKRGRHAFRRCVRQHLRQAAQTCRAERRADKDAFRTKYGNEKGRHAFRRCVRQHAGDPVGEQQQGTGDQQG